VRSLLRFTLLLALAAGCQKKPDEVKHRVSAPYVIPNVPDSAFDEVEGQFLGSACSPEITDDDFRGIVLNGPKRVLFGPDTRDPRFGSFTRMIVCGVCQLDHHYLGIKGNFSTKITFFAVNVKTHRVHVGRLHAGIEVFPERDPDDPRQNVVTGEWFNPNLALISDIPPEEADYLVYATLGDYKSNTVTIQLRRKPETDQAP
jgi:hypothetical protein